ncbi:c-type cytochrome [Sandarakinorhabdus rubra]|uniref:c-type cytochrome n=1 Tax=Sandarakinorhabdus rubra TaxID=2672568 RepID=UPI0013DC9CB0|nr:cytochrome c [Sandarakinorhabdus rubra]
MRFVLLATALMVAAPALAQKAKAPAAPHPGAEVYQNVCQACHMANALGGEGAGKIPALAKNGALEASSYPIMVVTGGKGAMPWFRGQLTDQQIADVINYVRSHFGNRYKDKVTPAMVAEQGVPAPKGGFREQ